VRVAFRQKHKERHCAARHTTQLHSKRSGAILHENPKMAWIGQKKRLIIEYPAWLIAFPTDLYSSNPNKKITLDKLDHLCKHENLKIIEANRDPEAVGDHVSIQLHLEEHDSSSEHVVSFGLMKFVASALSF
jgi:hypothetical protein